MFPRIYLLIFCFVCSTVSFAQQVKIGIYPDKEIQAVVFSVVSGNYSLILNDKIVKNIYPGSIFFVSKNNDQILINDSNEIIGASERIELKGNEINNQFQIKSVLPPTISSDFDGNLILQIVNNRIQIINLVDAEKYITGVVEAEGGSNAMPEYYKAQAVLVRTYMYRNMYRHGADGFNLCNNQHCQAYKGRSMLNNKIYEAVKLTSGLVLTDFSNQLLFAPYHSNCGGITGTSDLVWQNHEPCLQPVKDPFCAAGHNSNWTKKILYSEWVSYLNKNGLNELFLKYPFTNETRKKEISNGNSFILLKKIRDDFNLKSTFFSISRVNEYVLFKGKGYGHGVGLCQEGAIEMANVGFTYIDILHFYFRDVLIQPFK